MEASHYNLIMYDESLVIGFINNLRQTKGKNSSSFHYAYILHNKDENPETGEIKKAHWHIWLEFPQPVKSQIIEGVLLNIGSSTTALSHDRTDANFLAYLTHDTKGARASKALYSLEDVFTDISPDVFADMYSRAVERLTRPTRHERTLQATRNALTLVVDLCKQRPDIVDFSSLLSVLMDSNDDETLSYVFNKRYAIEGLCKPYWNQNLHSRLEGRAGGFKALKDPIKEMTDYELKETYTRLHGHKIQAELEGREYDSTYYHKVLDRCIEKGIILAEGFTEEREE